MGKEKSSATAEETSDQSKMPDIEITPLTTFRSNDDNEPNNHKDVGEGQSFEVASKLTLNANRSSRNILGLSLNIIDEQKPSNAHMTTESVAAWIESTKTELSSPTIERSPSLPLTLFEPMAVSSRNKSTISEHQRSMSSGPLTLQQVSLRNDIQCDLSVPISDRTNNDDNQNDADRIRQMNKEIGDEEDRSTKFFPIPEYEVSSANARIKNLNLEDEKQAKFVDRLIPTSESQNKSSNVSSVLLNIHDEPLICSRRERCSWNISENKPSSDQLSQSTMTSNPSTSLPHFRIPGKQFKTVPSTTNGANDSSINQTQRFSHISNNLFFSTNDKYLPSSCRYSQVSQFRMIPSSDSNPSFDLSFSGSTDLETHLSDQMKELNIKDDKIIDGKQQQQSRPTSSGTQSTQSLSSSSSFSSSSSSSSSSILYDSNKKRKNSTKDKSKRPKPIDKKRDVLKQLMWLLERRLTINPRFSFAHRKSSNYTKPQLQKITTNPFVEV